MFTFISAHASQLKLLEYPEAVRVCTMHRHLRNLSTCLSSFNCFFLAFFALGHIYLSQFLFYSIVYMQRLCTVITYLFVLWGQPEILSYLPDLISTKIEGNDFHELQWPYLTFLLTQICHFSSSRISNILMVGYQQSITWNPRFLCKLFSTPRVSW